MNYQTYTSITIWQGEPEWKIEVRVSGFPTIQAAATFGDKQVKKLKHEPNADYLILIDSSGHHHKIEQAQVSVHKQNPETQGKLVVNAFDFTPVDVKIKDFSNIDGLDRGFGSLAYGVLNADLTTTEF